VPVLPVAHNAGELWGKKQFLKHPGTITVAIGEPISTSGRDASEVLKDAQEWIENTQAGILPPARGHALGTSAKN
jgi:1-acyl-sn-glycerol-3-phosphate acyltransferase